MKTKQSFMIFVILLLSISIAMNAQIKRKIEKVAGKNVKGVQGYEAEIKDGGYAIISVSNEEICASVWYKNLEWGCRMKKKFI